MSCSAKKFFGNPQLVGIRPHPGQRRLHGLLHHLADLPGHGEAALAFHGVGFDKQNIAAGGRPGQADHHAGALGALGNFAFAADFDPTQKFLNDFLGHHQLFGFAFRQPPRLLAANGADVPLQVAHPGFARVVADEVAHGFRREIQSAPP